MVVDHFWNMRVFVGCFLCLLFSVVSAQFTYCDEAPRILAIGSSTVFPIGQLFGRKYTDMDVLPVVTSSGSTLGLRNLITGAADIGQSSRPLQPKDYDNAECDGTLVSSDGTATSPCQGVLPVPVKVANDALAIIVHPDSQLDSMSLQDVVDAFSGDQYTFVIPDKLSGTYDYFIEVVGDAVDANLQGTEGYADDSALIEALSNTPNGIGWVGLGAVKNNNKVKVLTIDGIDPKNTQDYSNYPYFRPLFMYYDSQKGDDQYQNMIQKYLCDVLGSTGQRIVSDVGFLALSSDEVSQETDKLQCSGVSSDFPTYQYGSEQFQFCKDVFPIVVTGSSTVYPVINQAQNNNKNIFLLPVAGSSGSSVGIATFLAGGNNLAVSSRALRGKDYEEFDCDGSAIDETGAGLTTCQGRLPKSMTIGRDMLSIIVNSASTMTDVSIADLQKIFIDVSEGMTLCGADKQSGTRDFFEDEIGKITSPDFRGFANDAAIVDCVKQSSNAIGFVPVAYLSNVTDVKILTVEGKDPLTQQSEYPLSRPLFVIYDSLPLQTEKQDKKFMCMLLSDDGYQMVADVGYTPLSAEEIEEELRANQLLCRFQSEFSSN